MNNHIEYYTPSIEELHVGFEFEILGKVRDNSGRKTWNKVILSNEPTFIKFLFDKYFIKEPSFIRVKYLDKEDIESLEFNQIEYDTYTFKHYFFEFNNEHKIFIYHVKNRLTSILFVGTVKNKSELKVLMRQLSIK